MGLHGIFSQRELGVKSREETFTSYRGYWCSFSQEKCSSVSRIVETGIWRRNFPWVSAYKFWWSELLQGHAIGTNFWPLNSGRKNAEELWPLNRSIERGIPTGSGLRRCRTDCKSVCFDRASGFELHIFLHLFFLLELYFPYFYKKNWATFSPRVRTYPFSRGLKTHGNIFKPRISGFQALS